MNDNDRGGQEGSDQEIIEAPDDAVILEGDGVPRSEWRDADAATRVGGPVRDPATDGGEPSRREFLAGTGALAGLAAAPSIDAPALNATPTDPFDDLGRLLPADAELPTAAPSTIYDAQPVHLEEIPDGDGYPFASNDVHVTGTIRPGTITAAVESHADDGTFLSAGLELSPGDAERLAALLLEAAHAVRHGTWYNSNRRNEVDPTRGHLAAELHGGRNE